MRNSIMATFVKIAQVLFPVGKPSKDERSAETEFSGLLIIMIARFVTVTGPMILLLKKITTTKYLYKCKELEQLILKTKPS